MAVFLPGESHGQRSLVGYSPWGHKELDITEVTVHAVIEIICLNNFYISTVCKSKTLETVYIVIRRGSVNSILIHPHSRILCSL